MKCAKCGKEALTAVEVAFKWMGREYRWLLCRECERMLEMAKETAVRQAVWAFLADRDPLAVVPDY